MLEVKKRESNQARDLSGLRLKKSPAYVFGPYIFFIRNESLRRLSNLESDHHFGGQKIIE